MSYQTSMPYPFLNPKKILVLERANKKQVSIEECLSYDMRFQIVHVCHDSHELKKALNFVDPHLIVADYNFAGDIHGFEILEACRYNYPTCPFVFTVDSMDKNTAKETVISNADAYVTKDKIGFLPSILERAWTQHLQKLQIERFKEKVFVLKERLMNLKHDLKST